MQPRQPMPESEFNNTAIYYHLKQHFFKQNIPQRQPAELKIEENHLIQALEKLSSSIIIPPSSLDDSIRKLLEQTFETLALETTEGLRISTTKLEQVNDEIYSLTVVGKIESTLRDYIVDCLRSHLNDVETYVDEQEAAHNRIYENAWEEYNTEISQFEEGDEGYDYEGPIYPQEPTIQPFKRKKALAQRRQELSELDLNNPEVILREAPIEANLLGDMLHEHFDNCELIEDIIKQLDFTHLHQSHISHLLRTKNYYFPDCDIFKRGFLLEILIDNIKQDFTSDRPKVDIHEHIVVLFSAMSASDQCKELLEKYNAAVVNQDNLELQRLWYYISALCTAVEKAMRKPPINIKELTTQLENQYKSIKQEHGGSLNALVKVFPSDTVDNLFYPGLSAEENEGHYPSCDATLPLRPYFHTLELIARNTHDALVKVAGTQKTVERTNVVSALLCFVMSTEPDKQAALTSRPSKQIFINVPVNLDYKSVILSLDEVFNDEDDIEISIGTDLESGKRVAQRDVTMPLDETESVKKLIMRLVNTFKLDETKKSEWASVLGTADVDSPTMLSYLVSSDISKSTEHHHSERVLIRALKEPNNIAKIILGIKQSMAKHDLIKPGTYTIQSGALLVYSYPNSICDECSISFLALQNSYKSGFLDEFIRAANTNEPNAEIKLRTRGFNSQTRTQNQDEFSMTVIAGSSKVFSKDAYAKLIVSRPEAKYACHSMPYLFSAEGISLRSTSHAAGNNRLYEYTADSKLHEDKTVTVPYSGKLFMSGSKKSKLASAKKQQQLETAIKKVVDDCVGTQPMKLSA